MRNYVTAATKAVFINDSTLNTEELEKYVILFNYYNRSANLTKFDDKPSIEQEQAIYNDDIKNAEYLMLDFPADFNTEMLVQKYSETKDYENIYSNFEVNDTGIHLINNDPITLNRIKEFFNRKDSYNSIESNLKNYFKLHKQGFAFPTPLTQSVIMDNTFYRNYYSNFPTALQPYVGDFHQYNPDVIVAKTKDKFIRVKSGVFEEVNTIGNLGVYSKLNTIENTYKEYNKELTPPVAEVDLTRIKANVIKTAPPVIADLISSKEKLELKTKFDNC